MRSILFSAEFDKQLAGLFSDGEAADNWLRTVVQPALAGKPPSASTFYQEFARSPAMRDGTSSIVMVFTVDDRAFVLLALMEARTPSEVHPVPVGHRTIRWLDRWIVAKLEGTTAVVVPFGRLAGDRTRR